MLLVGGVVDEYVETPELVDRRLDRLLAKAGVAHVAGDKQCIAAGLLDRRARFLRIRLFLGEVHERHVGALPREHQRHRPADTRITAGDEGRLGGELSGGPVQAGLVPGPGIHLLLQARLGDRLVRERRHGLRVELTHIDPSAQAGRVRSESLSILSRA